jgi:hypothetical protein
VTHGVFHVKHWVCAFAICALFPLRALAGPQVSTSLVVGGGLADARAIAPIKPRAVFQLGVWADAVFLRRRSSDMGLGAYVHFDTTAFDTVSFGGGATWLIPLGSPVLSLSAGALGRSSGRGLEPALSTTLFFGSKSYNFHSLYGLSAGLFVQGRYGVGRSDQADLLFGAQIDLAILALPILYVVESFKTHPSTFH